MNLPNIQSKLNKDAIALLTLIIIHLICLKYFQNFGWVGDEGRRPQALLISFLPSFFLFSLFRSFWDSKTALILAGGLETLLSVVHWTKLKLANEPLVWSDFVTIWDNTVLPKYITLRQVLLAGLFLLWVGWLIRHNLKSVQFRFIKNPWFFLCLLFVPLVFFPKANLVRLQYYNADWRTNAQMNGLFHHLVQTSQKAPSLSYSEADKRLFDNLSQNKRIGLERPNKIIFILCESCWYDETHFKDLFQPLFDRGFQSFRAISPVYAGGTPNTSFEVLTGLPSTNNYLGGVIYQEHASSLSKRVHALPQYLHDEGYATFAFHNNNRTFWQRHIVNPKLGFDTFLGLEAMAPSSSDDWPDDGILFSVGLDRFNQIKDQKGFFYFTTIHTHGPYGRRNDLGEAEYRRKVETSISRLTYFLDQVLKKDPNTLVLIYGDHKPGLTEFFMREGIFTDQDFQGRGKWDSVGDVPMFLKHSNSDRVQKVVSAANRLPIFCAVEALDRELIGSGLPAFSYARQMSICENYSEKGYSYYRDAYPEWLYAISLFEKEPARFGRVLGAGS